MKYYYQEIFNGLKKVPTPNYPGNMIIAGESQAVLTGENPGDVIIAAHCYEKGRIIVAAHDCYLDWFKNPDSDLKKNLNKNFLIWLGKKVVKSSEIGSLEEISSNNQCIDSYKIILWNHFFDPSDEEQDSLLSWLKNGGGLLCASTPWGYLQIFPSKNLNDMALHRFLVKNTGITFTKDTLFIPDEINVSESKPHLSNFDHALSEVSKNSQKLAEYSDTISQGLGKYLNDSKKLDEDKLKILKQLNSRCRNLIPNENNPISESDKKMAINLLGKSLCCFEGEKAPGIEIFPGDFKQLPDLLQNVLIKIESNFSEWISTGYYLPAGICLNVQVKSGDLEGWSIRIGSHSDDNSRCESYKRWPCISLVKTLQNIMNFSSPYGGLVYFESSKPGCLEIQLSNVVESPYFDLTKKETIDNWSKNRNAPGLWAELAGENVIFTTPSSCIRQIEDPTDVLNFWDRVAESHHECRGTNVKDFRRERVVNDMQPVVGYMHSGYPIVTHLDCCQRKHEECIFDLKKLMKNGNWGLFHELGHNMQRNEWTFDGTTEVTVNIFSLHAGHIVLNRNILEQKWPNDVKPYFETYFARQPTYDDFKNECGMALMMFIQLIKHFGWESMYEFMKTYEDDIKNNSNLPQSEQDKINQWVLRYSKIVSRNIKPQFEMFGLPVSSHIETDLESFEPWCPYDEMNADTFFGEFVEFNQNNEHLELEYELEPESNENLESHNNYTSQESSVACVIS
ncbi:unnamed protein product [Brachionus calyciflorus]|uniref:Peptidase M60 domain-containing protein n=1 Tax=Brachionus calyciflorus TaxID=104777 RepID=A0A814H984_9BILA|nr:unnamed protein product [Brachionus calyciflorus]